MIWFMKRRGEMKKENTIRKKDNNDMIYWINSNRRENGRRIRMNGKSEE